MSRATTRSLRAAVRESLDTRRCFVCAQRVPRGQGVVFHTNLGILTCDGEPCDARVRRAWRLDVDGTCRRLRPRGDGIVMAPRTAGQYAKLKDTQTNPMRVPPILEAIPRMVTTSVSIAEGSAQSSLYLGDWTKLFIGMRTSLRVEVLRERYADSLQFGFLAYMRADVAVAYPTAFGRLISIPAVVMAAREAEEESEGRGRKR